MRKIKRLAGEKEKGKVIEVVRRGGGRGGEERLPRSLEERQLAGLRVKIKVGGR